MTTLKLRSKGDSVRLLQELLVHAGYSMIVDGKFGKETENAVKNFQLKNNLIADGIAGTKTWTKLQDSSPKKPIESSEKFLSEKDLAELAKDLNVETAVIKAVYEVESSGRGFLASGIPKILFEGHIFWGQLKIHGLNPNDFIKGNEEILYPKWTRKFYKGGEKEYDRLNKAKLINEAAALESASWGIFQIMGFHYGILGYKDAKAYVKDMYKSEKYHLIAFGNFIKSKGLVEYLKKKEWAKFAYRYNGAGYKTNRYDDKLAAAYKKYTK